MKKKIENKDMSFMSGQYSLKLLQSKGKFCFVEKLVENKNKEKETPRM